MPATCPRKSLEAACISHLDTLLRKGSVSSKDLPAGGALDVQGRMVLLPDGCTSETTGGDDDTPERLSISCADRRPAMLTWIETPVVGDVDAADALLAATLDAVEQARGLQAWHEEQITCVVEGQRGRCLKAGLPVDSDGDPRGAWFGHADFGDKGLSVMCSYQGEVDALPETCAQSLVPWK